MFVLLSALLFVNFKLIQSELICVSPEDPSITYKCPKNEHQCCPEGCCIHPFVIPKVSLALALNICAFILILCFACWCVQFFIQMCQNYGFVKKKRDEKTPTSDATGWVCEPVTPPPSYSVAINFPVPTYEEAVSKTDHK